jgi:6-phosphogluconolactonase
MKEIKVYSDNIALTKATAELFVALAQEAINTNGRFSVALSGGSTPYALFTLLATPEYAAKIDWSKTYLFWGDERHIPPDSPDSNYNMTYATLISKINIPAENVLRILGEDEPEAAAQAYEDILHNFFGNDQPAFDFQLLGMGDDGHTASLFPGTAAVHEQKKWVVAHYVEKVGMWRITLTPTAINASKTIAFVVSGSGKADRLKSVLEGDYDPDLQPSQIVKPINGKLLWLLDEAAAAKLDKALL